jgi:hypothetical protein
VEKGYLEFHDGNGSVILSYIFWETVNMKHGRKCQQLVPTFVKARLSILMFDYVVVVD